jgi:putative CocE/NonD family hydrolase
VFIPGVHVERDLACEMRDGVTLYADVYRPDGDGPWPVLLMRTPYDKTMGESDVGYSHPSWFARQGFLVVVQDCRGRWSSEGAFEPFANEASDGVETIEWAARLPGSDGRVTMYGFSYPGAAQLLAAVERPPSLVAICPGFTASQYYDGWTYDAGALSLAFAASWATYLAVDGARRRGDDAAVAELQVALMDAPRHYWTLPLRDHPVTAGPDAKYLGDWIAHSKYDQYWKRWSIDEDYGRIEVPALHVGGWYDVFLSGTVKNFVRLQQEAGTEEARRRQKLVIGPWHHMPWAPVQGQGTGDGDGYTVVDDLTVDWLDRTLGRGEPRDDDAPVRLYVLHDGWRDFQAWPPPESRQVEYHLHSGGRANSRFGDGTLSTDPARDEAPDVFVYDPRLPVMSVGGHSCCVEAVTPMGPACQLQTEASKNVLVYTTEPLERELTLVGDASVTVYAASTAVDTDFTARLCVVEADGGCSVNLQEGIVRARFRDSLEEPRLIEPGRVYEYRIDLGPVGARVAAGKRLRLDLSSSDFPIWDRNLNTGGELGAEGPSEAVVAVQTVIHDQAHPSRLSLPVLG